MQLLCFGRLSLVRILSDRICDFPEAALWGGWRYLFLLPVDAAAIQTEQGLRMKTYPGPHLEIVSGTWQVLKGARNNKRTKEDLGRSFYLAPVAESALGWPLVDIV